MTPQYFITPAFCVAVNYKAGSSALARAIIHAFYPNLDAEIQNGAYPFIDDGAFGWHFLCPITTTPDKPVVLLVRDPVERFVSGLRQLSVNQRHVNAFLEMLETDKRWQYSSTQSALLRSDVHFRPQAALVSGDTHLFKFPENLEEAARLIGLYEPVRPANVSASKIQLTRAQTLRVQAYYSEDCALFESITTPGTVVRAKF